VSGAENPRGRGVVVGLLGAVVLANLSCCKLFPRHGPNIILIISDTLRADHLGSYGYFRDTSPHIDALGADGVVVRNVIAQAPATIPSVPALLTSNYASRSYDPSRDVIPQHGTTLAEALREHGYRTAAFSSNPLVSARKSQHGLGGIDRGFGLFDDSVAYGEDAAGWSDQWRSASGIVNKAIKWLEGATPGKKFFLYLHIMDPHDVYWPPRRFRSRYHAGYRGKEDIAKGRPAVYEQQILKGEEVDLRRRDIEHLVALYDAEVAYVDVQVGRLLEKLERMGLREDTLVVVTSDHGEEFFEHGGLKHGFTLYQEVIVVPLLMRYPGALPSEKIVDGAVVQLIDVAPTILDLAGLPIPEEMTGASLVPRILGDRSTSRRYAITETPYTGAKAVVTDRWKYIHHFGGAPWRKDLADRYYEGTELYDLKEDPGERENCVDEHEDVAARLHELLVRDLPEAQQERLGEGSELGEEARQRLRSLGYVQ
jgi:arylsulfatase A-like enzyme